MPENPNSSAATPCDWRHDLLPGSCSHSVQVDCGISAWHFSHNSGGEIPWVEGIYRKKPMENIPFSMIKTYQNLGFFPVFDYFLKPTAVKNPSKAASPGMREDRNQPCPLETLELWMRFQSVASPWCSHWC